MTKIEASAVLIMSHGSRDPRAAYVVSALVAAIGERTGREVRAAHLDFTAPTPSAALVKLANDGFRAVRVVPLLFTPGYHLTHDVPSAVAASGVAARMQVSVAPALLSSGRHARHLLLSAMTERLAQAGADRHVDALVLASAGSSAEAARLPIEKLARALARTYGIPVLPAFASAADPSPAQALKALSDNGIRRPAVASLFVAPGRLPDSVVATCPNIPVADPLGVSPAFVELLVAQAQVLSSAR
jgi:sirohydrochlorin ferrochelatase